jgi:hypothetical protein
MGSVSPETLGRRRITKMLQFGVFDHLDHDGTSLGDQLEDRLRLDGVLEAEGLRLSCR